MALCFERLDELDERTHYIVFGYIRSLSTRCFSGAPPNIPQLIQYVVCLYVDDYFMLDNGTYTWLIDKQSNLKKMLDAKIGEKFESSVFDICKLKWILYAYPNGYNLVHQGSFKLYLKLLSPIPSTWKNIIICIRTRCKEIHLLYTSIKSIKKDSRIPLWSNATLLKADIFNIFPHSLTFEINIKILRIILNAQNKIFYQFELNKSYQRRQSLKWKLDSKLIQNIKKNGCRMGSSFESKVFYNQWCLTAECVQCIFNILTFLDFDVLCVQVCPNSNKGNVILCLQLICLPANIAKLKVQYTLRCEEADAESSTVKMFEYEQGKSYGLWSASKKLSFEHFKLYDSITLSADIIILDEIKCDFGGNSEEEIEEHWVEYKKQKELFQEISSTYAHDSKYDHLERRMNVLSDQMHAISESINALNDTMQSFIKVQKSRNIEECKKSDLWVWLDECVGLVCYYDLFVEHGFDDLSVVSSLRMNDLLSIGIDKLGHRLKIMKSIALLETKGQKKQERSA